MCFLGFTDLMILTSNRENKLDLEQEKRSFLRIKLQLNMVSLTEIDANDTEVVTKELEKYTVGTVRSVEDFETHSGVSFKTGVISETAKSGGLPPNQFADYVLSLLSQMGAIPT